MFYYNLRAICSWEQFVMVLDTILVHCPIKPVEVNNEANNLYNFVPTRFLLVSDWLTKTVTYVNICILKIKCLKRLTVVFN